MITIQSVSKSFHKQKVLDDISLTIERGEIFGLLGPSGAGKTTLIRLITGAEKRDSGEIFVDAVSVPDRKVLQRIGFMPQNDALYTDITGFENLRFFGGLFGLHGAVLKEKISECLQLVDLSQDAKKPVSNYSGGMKKRLSLAAALIHSPDVLVLDEPTVGIDPVLRRKIWEEFDRQRNSGKTIIVTTHVMDEIQYCDRAGLIYEGKLIACDTVEQLRKMGKGSVENLFFFTKQGENDL
ncbi:MAG: ABC transporter ATP-binding protein [Clostridiales bacterium 43-6]|nr:MAG: ABC transporter ATP-binding protein [Clostridiales bacterium 43-6]